MTPQTTDAAQALAEMMAKGHEWLREVSTAPAAAAPDIRPPGMAKPSARQQQDLATELGRFWTNMSAFAGLVGPASSRPAPHPPIGSDVWESTWADAVKRTYLACSRALESSVDNAAVEERTKEQVRLGLRQFIDAISPANFLMTNPEALQLARDTNGQSLSDGVRLFFEDLAKGRISTTDESAFEIGRNVAATPGAVVFENALIQLIQYVPVTAEVSARPLLVVPPCINKYYILDLQPENSFVRYALERGHPVFMVSWRSATPDHATLTWDDYVEQGVLAAIEVTLRVTGADRVNALGFCLGGTLLTCALAVMADRDESKVASLTLLTTMLDFSDAGELGKLISEQSVAAKEAAIGASGILDGKELAFAFSSLRANDLIWQYVSNSYLKGKAPPAFDMLYWNGDSANLPGPMFCWYLRNAYLENKLRVPGATTQCGVPVDLSKVHVPAFLYASVDDHIVPWKTAFASREILSGDTIFVLGASGHIAGVINPPAKMKRSYRADGVHDGDPQHWLDTAQTTPGSWWPRWADWLAQYSGVPRPHSGQLGSETHPVIEPAPGRYVMQKA